MKGRIKILISIFFLLSVSGRALAIKCDAHTGNTKCAVNKSAKIYVAQLTAVDNIQDSINHQELKQIMIAVLSNTEGKIGEIIKQFSINYPKWKWIVKEGTLPKNTNATTTLTSEGAVTILDYNKLKNATKLSVARTIIHELVHAYLTLFFKYDRLNANKTYPLILTAWQTEKKPDYNNIQHLQMELSFVDDIAIALKAYGNSINLLVNDNVYLDLAWGGLDFQNNEKLTGADKRRIQFRLSAEQMDVAFSEIYPTGPKLN